jgi:hypothetical protein
MLRLSGWGCWAWRAGRQLGTGVPERGEEGMRFHSLGGGFSFLEVFELADDHVAVGEADDDLEFSAHGGDETPQRADVHVGRNFQGQPFG